MKSNTEFTVLIESRRLVRAAFTAVAATAVALLGMASLPAHGMKPSQRPAHSKVADDMGAELSTPGKAGHAWSRARNGRREVQAIVTADSPESMASLAKHIERIGGAVLVRHDFIHSMTVALPANRVRHLAEHPDVAHISPNRAIEPTYSTLERVSGAISSKVRTNSTRSSYTGLDGSGIGIAIVDSGIHSDHLAFRNGAGANRVQRQVSMLNTSVANWTTTGTSTTYSYEPNSTARNSYESQINNAAAAIKDGYGHGTHVASVAAGFAKSLNGATPDMTGVAPNANLYAVKVLSDTGAGTVADAIEGIQWVIYHAREYNIKVMNLSIAAQSADSWKVDPLAAAARAAVASGITVVVAAGNYGRDALNREVHGRIGSPGHEPLVITVGAVNFKGTHERSDDTVANFSSRGPTRGAFNTGSGIVRDNLLKPDLVAPGNRIVGAAAKSATGGWNRIAANFWSTVGVAGTQFANEEFMQLAGTSIAAPAVSGTVALMLQANPGLTPPLIKAMLQYSAQPIAGASLVQQGTGLLNAEGAVELARAAPISGRWSTKASCPSALRA